MTSSIFKICVVGSSSSGRTSLVNRFVFGHFGQEIETTLGVNCEMKNIVWNAQLDLNVMLCEGQFSDHVMSTCFDKARGVLIVYDSTSTRSFKEALEWKRTVDRVDKSLPCVLVATKCDLEASQLIDRTPEELDRVVRECGFIGWMKTSAKDNYNVSNTFNTLIEMVHGPPQAPAEPIATIQMMNDNTQQQSGVEDETSGWTNVELAEDSANEKQKQPKRRRRAILQFLRLRKPSDNASKINASGSSSTSSVVAIVVEIGKEIQSEKTHSSKRASSSKPASPLSPFVRVESGSSQMVTENQRQKFVCGSNEEQDFLINLRGSNRPIGVGRG